MKFTHHTGWLSAPIVLLLLISLACNLPGRTAVEPTPLPTIPVSNEAVESLQETIESAKEAFNNDQTVEITLTEAQLTSAAALEVEADPDMPLSDPQIYLRDGQVTLVASLTQNKISVPLEINLELSTDGQGNPVYKIVKGQIGPLPIPENIMNRLTSRLDQIIASKSTVDNSQIFIESITIGDGTLTLRGHKR